MTKVSDSDRAKVLSYRKKKFTDRQISIMTGINRSTVWNILNRKRRNQNARLKYFSDPDFRKKRYIYDQSRKPLRRLYEQKRRLKNKESLRVYYREYQKKRSLNSNFRLIRNYRSRIRMALKNNTKYSASAILVGCSMADLRLHLKKQFQTGMSWNNYGKWRIDHIRPCASFDLSKPEEQKKCFHYSNLQPLWAKDNLFKGSKIIDNFVFN